MSLEIYFIFLHVMSDRHMFSEFYHDDKTKNGDHTIGNHELDAKSNEVRGFHGVCRTFHTPSEGCPVKKR